MLKRIAVLLAILLLIGFCLALALWWWQPILIHISQETGTSNSASRAYSFWSGFGSDLGEVTLIAAILTPAVVAYHHHKCVECHRLSRHKTEDTAQRFCHHHWTREHVDMHRELHRLKFPCHLAHDKPVMKGSVATFAAGSAQIIPNPPAPVVSPAPVKTARPKKASKKVTPIKGTSKGAKK